MGQQISDSSVVKANENVVSADLGSGTALLDLQSTTYYSLNEVGARIWSLIQEPKPVSAIHDELLRQFAVDPARCHDDLIALLGQLADAGLVTVTDGAHP